jgi:putative FmdB family regulatory protein
MPRYDFRCQSCGAEFEASLPMARRDEAVCPECGSREKRQLFRQVQAFIKGGGGGGPTCAPSPGG